MYLQIHLSAVTVSQDAKVEFKYLRFNNHGHLQKT